MHYQIVRVLQCKRYRHVRATLFSWTMGIESARRLLVDVYAQNSVRAHHGCTARIIVLPRMYRAS